jgi:hypothetical protein
MSLGRATGIVTSILMIALLGQSHAAKAPSQSDRAAETTHWSFRPTKRPPVPDVRNRDWLHNPVDTFVLAELEKKSIKPAPDADRRTLLRRVFFDLIGLPPTPQEMDAFLKDPSPDAYVRVVDDLLSRPQYGERWARHWLDVVRYAETNGYERDGPKPHAWRYRDYVIQSFNRDKPFDRFLTEQLAGDEIPGTNAETQTATTFLRLGTWDDEPAEPQVDRYDQLDDVLGTTATAFLGITLRCARCHDHKFEPFTQKDYYRMLAVFEPLKRPQKGRMDLDRFVGTETELNAYRTALARAEAGPDRLRKDMEAIHQAIRNRLFARPAPKGAGSAGKQTGLPPDAVAAFRVEAGKRTALQQKLVKKYRTQLEAEIRAAATAEEKARLERLEKELASLQVEKPVEPPRAYIWYEDGPRAPVTHVLRRGDPKRPLGEVGPGLPRILVHNKPDPPKPLAKSTGRRLWLARWMTDPANPLVARVIVNRIWQRHFGKGLVATANDFGVMGELPSHPALLDWLASELVAGGWKLKPLHRLMVLSHTYQQSSASNPAATKIDPEGQLLWRWRQRRLEAEAVRDGVLAVTGRLNSQMAGPSVYPTIPRAVLEGQSRPGNGWGKSDAREAARRSVYIFVKRVLAVPELELLDSPDTTSSCEQRPVSTTAPQALTFLNGDFMQQQARHLAARLVREAGHDPASQVRRAFELALNRPARPEELKLARSFLGAQKRQIIADAAREGQAAPDAGRKALEGLCLVILNTSEFVYLN